MKEDQKKDLKETLIVCLGGIFLPDTWSGFGNALMEILLVLFLFMVRLFLLVTFPISIPVVYWLNRRERNARRKYMEKANTQINQSYGNRTQK